MDNTNEVSKELLRLAPAGVVPVTQVMGVCLADWVYIVTIGYFLIQSVCIIYKTFFKKEGKK